MKRLLKDVLENTEVGVQVYDLLVSAYSEHTVVVVSFFFINLEQMVRF